MCAVGRVRALGREWGAGSKARGQSGSLVSDTSEPTRVKEKCQLLSSPWGFWVWVVIQREEQWGEDLKDEHGGWWRGGDGNHPSPLLQATA